VQNTPRPWTDWQWENLSLARQFALAGGTVMLVAVLAVGLWVSRRIEDVVVRSTASATALYMESFVAPLLQELTHREGLSSEARLEVARLLKDTALGERVVSFKLWRAGGLLADAMNEELVGQRFEVTENLRLAWEGEVRADLEQTKDTEDVAENAMGIPLLEIYTPIRNARTGEVIAVAEFYEVASELKSDLVKARLASWAAVAAVMAAIGISLFAIVLRGSWTIDRQMDELKSLSARNVALRMRAHGAAGRVAALNDSTLKRIGADLHDGPVQLLGFAALRLDALRMHNGDAKAQDELNGVEQAVRDAMGEIRSIARGLSLPDIDERSLADLLQSLALGHSERTGTAVDFECDIADHAELSAAVKTCVYRVAQEGLTNAWRHGGGVSQKVQLAICGDVLTLSVLDRGPGLPPGAKSAVDLGHGGMGLAGLTDRVESLEPHRSRYAGA
jgi:signal transduction histidine kinase